MQRLHFQHGARTPMNRDDVTQQIITAKVGKGPQWAQVAEEVGLSKE